MTEIEELIEKGESAIRKTTDVLGDFKEVFLKEKLSSHDDHQKKKADDKFYVTELFQCREKIRLKTREDSKGALQASTVISGILTEEGMNSYMEKLGYDTQIRWEKPIGDFRVSGRIDFYHPEKRLGVELKSPVYVKKPKDMENYVNQCKGYLWLAKDSEHPLDKVHLVQLTSTGMREDVITEGFTDDDISGFIAEPGYPVYLFECRYCNHKDECDYFGKLE